MKIGNRIEVEIEKTTVWTVMAFLVYLCMIAQVLILLFDLDSVTKNDVIYLITLVLLSFLRDITNSFRVTKKLNKNN
jgi:positive regulator of sigma E activity